MKKFQDTENKVILVERLPHIRRYFVSFTLLLTSTFFIYVSLADNLVEISESISTMDLITVGFSVLPLIAEAYVLAYTYSLIVGRFEPLSLPTKEIVLPYVASQIAQYLPGKIWPLIYLLNSTSRLIAPRSILGANIEHSFLIKSNTVAVATAAIVYYYLGITAGMLTYFIMLLLPVAVLKTSVAQKAAALMFRLINIHKGSWPGRIRVENNKTILILIQASWLFFFMACACILPSSFSLKAMVVIAACYAGAWMVGAIATVMPNGLFVREAAFIWMTGLLGFEAAQMFSFGIVLRIMFIFSDVLCALISIALHFSLRDSLPKGTAQCDNASLAK